MRLALAAIASVVSGCTLVTANGFDECDVDSQCGGGRVCAQARYCIRLPEGCDRALGATDKANRIPLAATLPLTVGGSLDGGVDESEVQGLNAIALALEQVNQRDGVGGRPFSLYVCNTGGDKDRIKVQAEWLNEQLGVPALFTSGSSQTISVHTVTVPRGMVVISATATSPEITSLNDSHEGSVGLVWRTAPSDAIQGRVVAELLIAGCQSPRCTPAIAPVTKVGVLYVDDPYGQGLANVLRTRFGQSPRELRAIPFPRGANDAQISAAVDGLAQYGPQVSVLIAFPEDATRILQQAKSKPALTRTSGHRWFFSDSAKDPATIAGAPPGELDGAYGTAPAQGAGSAFPAFKDAFFFKYKVDPLNYSFTSHSYDAMYALALGAAWAVGADGKQPLTGKRMAEGLTKLSSGTSYLLSPDQFIPARTALQNGTSVDIEGTSGKLNFDSTSGEAPSPIELWQVVESTTSFRTVDTIQPPEN